MKYILLLILSTIISIIDVTAQEADTLHSKPLSTTDSLKLQIERLQHDHDYLFCEYHFNRLTNEFKNIANQANIKSNAILINCYHNNFDIDLYIVYRDDLTLSREYLKTLEKSISSTQTLVALKATVSDFSTLELDVLKNSYATLEKAISSASGAIDYYETVLDLYKKGITK